ncbi:25904_t:CDS:2, partial [Racocetra persica]
TMPCYADTIVRVKYVSHTTKDDSNLIVVWAVGSYPVGREDSEIEMVLFVPTNVSDRDPETQAVFERDGFYSVGGKIIPGYYGGKKRPKMTVSISTVVKILNNDDMSNKCPLKISLIGIPQELSKHKFIVKVVFPHSNSRLGHLKSTVRPHDSLIFVVGQLEVIDNDFYIYAKDINFVDINHFKQKILDDGNSSNSSEVVNLTRSKLLFTHRNVNENFKDIAKVESSSTAISNNDLSSMSGTSKHARIEDDNESIDVFDDSDSSYVKLDEANSSIEVVENEVGGELGSEECLENIVCSSKKGKDYASRSLRDRSL